MNLKACVGDLKDWKRVSGNTSMKGSEKQRIWREETQGKGEEQTLNVTKIKTALAITISDRLSSSVATPSQVRGRIPKSKTDHSKVTR